MSHEQSPSDSSHRGRKLVIGAAGIAASGAAAGYLAYRKRRLEQNRLLDPQQAETYETSLLIFNEERIPVALRGLMARIGAAVYIADSNFHEPVINRAELKHMLHDSESTNMDFDNAIWYLKNSHLIEHRHKIVNPHSHGYAALPALEWGLVHMHDGPELLVQAHHDLVTDNL